MYSFQRWWGLGHDHALEGDIHAWLTYRLSPFPEEVREGLAMRGCGVRADCAMNTDVGERVVVYATVPYVLNGKASGKLVSRDAYGRDGARAG